MVEWRVEADGDGRWAVVRWQDGTRQEPRAVCTGLSCKGARVLAEQMRQAFQLGRESRISETVFGEPLGD